VAYALLEGLIIMVLKYEDDTLSGSSFVSFTDKMFLSFNYKGGFERC